MEIEWDYIANIDKRIAGRITIDELRKILKFRGEIPVRIYGNGKSFPAILNDISASGISIIAQKDIPEDLFVGVQFKIFNAVFLIGGLNFNCTVKVMRKHEIFVGSDKKFLYGTCFHNIKETYIDIIKNLYIEKVSHA